MPRGVPPPVPRLRQPYKLSAQPLDIKVRCGGPVHSLCPSDDLDTNSSSNGGAAPRALSYAGLVTTNPALLAGSIFGAEGLVPLSDKDRFIDLGCGHGHSLLAAREAAPRCRCIGVEFNPALVDVARRAVASVQREGTEPILVLHGNIDDCFPEPDGGVSEEACALREAVGLAEATVVYVYLGEWSNLKLRPRLLRVLPVGARVVTKSFSMGDAWPADAEAYGSDGTTLFRVHHVTAERKADAELQSDRELARRYGLRWLQPPNYLGRGPATARVDTAAPAVAATAPEGPAAELRRRAAGRLLRRGEPLSTAPRPLLGWSLVVGAVVVWVTLVYMTLLSKALPATGIAVLDWMRKDTYFCHLLPMLVPSLLLFRAWGWMSMELFKSA